MIDVWGPKLTKVLKDVNGLEKSYQYDDLPGAITVSPSTIWLPKMGPTLTYGFSSPTIMITQVQITLYLNASLLPTGVSKAVLLIDPILRVLAANMTLDGTVNYIMPRKDGPVWEGPAGLGYGTDVLTGVNFYYDVKENLNFEVSK